jgi:serine/threonine protein phosphatase 1
MPPSLLSRLFGQKSVASTRSTGGRVVYAVGDVHGRLDLLDPLLSTIARDVTVSRPDQTPLLIFLGDYVDRGPESAGVIDRVLSLQGRTNIETRALKGNHEEALLEFLAQPTFGPTWLDHGGGPTLAAYGVAPPAVRSDPVAWAAVRDAFALALPPAHLAFCQALELIVTVGDYAFVHAGVRPGVPLERQTEKDMLWIRGEFLASRNGFDKVIVHGHTPTQEPQLTPFRIGLDTGAYATGVLTAARIQDDDCRILQASVARAAS